MAVPASASADAAQAPKIKLLKVESIPFKANLPVIGEGHVGLVYKIHTLPPSHTIFCDMALKKYSISPKQHKEGLDLRANPLQDPHILVAQRVNHTNVLRFNAYANRVSIDDKDVVTYDRRLMAPLYETNAKTFLLDEPTAKCRSIVNDRLVLAKLNVLRGAARGLAALHAAGLVHNNVATRNIFLRKKDLSLLARCDGFEGVVMAGFSHVVQAGERWFSNFFVEDHGILEWAPEMCPDPFAEVKTVTDSAVSMPAADVYSFGYVIASIALCEDGDYGDEDEHHSTCAEHFLFGLAAAHEGYSWQRAQVQTRCLIDLHHLARVLASFAPDVVASGLADLARRAFSIDPSERPTMREISTRLDEIYAAMEIDVSYRRASRSLATALSAATSSPIDAQSSDAQSSDAQSSDAQSSDAQEKRQAKRPAEEGQERTGGASQPQQPDSDETPSGERSPKRSRN